MEFTFASLMVVALGLIVAGALLWVTRRRALRIKAQRRADQGNFVAAAKLLEEAGDRARAALLYHQGGDRLRAVQIHIELRDYDSAVEALRGGRPEEVEAGASLLTRELALDSRGRTASLAGVARSSGLSALAASLFEKSGNVEEAREAWHQEARSLAAQGKQLEASAIYERLGEGRSAAIAQAEAAKREPDLERRKMLADQAAVRLRELGDIPGASEALAIGGDVDAGVELLLSISNVIDAAQLLRWHGRHRDAAALFEQAGDFKRAARSYRHAGDMHQSAVMHEKAGDIQGAVRVLLDAHEFLAAAQVHLRSGAPLAAAEILANAGNMDGAVKVLLEVNDTDAAVDLLCRYRRPRDAVALLQARGESQRAALLLAEYGDFSQSAPLDGPSSGRPIQLTQAGENGPLPPIGRPPEWAGGPFFSDDITGLHENYFWRRAGVPSRYVVEKELGRGAMGVVYKALDSQLGRPVAIKVLEKHAGSDPRIREYFDREARAVAKIVHPNVVTLFDAGLEGDSPYLVMELVEGDDLRMRLQHGRIPVREAILLIAGVASALDMAHSQKIVHRDVKPENIILSGDGAAKLMDFGVAHIIAEGSERRATVVGTPVYMAPEQIRGDPIGGFTDTYALGVVLFECLTGVPPFEQNGALFHHVNTPPPDPRSLCPEIPVDLSKVVLHCLAKAPEDRPASAKILSDMLLALAPSMPPTPSADVPRPLPL